MIKVFQKYYLIPLCFFIMLVAVKAATFTMSVTVGNTAPTLVSMTWSPASTSATPVNIGASNLTFTAGTAADVNGDSVYLLVCDSASTATISLNGSTTPPTCSGTTYCVTGTAQLPASSTCIDATVDAITYPANGVVNWKAFVCDNATSQLCSAGVTGTNYINHAINFATAIASPAGAVPGSTLTFTLTALGWSDADIAPSADTGNIYICSTNSATSAGCAATTLCSISAATPGVIQNCASYTIPIPTAVGTYNSYVFIYDNHSLAATGQQGSAVTYSVTNAVPVLSALTFKTDLVIGTNIAPATNKEIHFTITDNNGCSTITTGGTVVGKLYRKTVPTYNYSNCSSTNERCISSMTCAVDGIDTCAGDSTVSYYCNATPAYYSDPTVAPVPWTGDVWEFWAQATDSNTGVSAVPTLPTTNLNKLNSHTPSSGSISYGSLAPLAGNATLVLASTLTNSGNIGLDALVDAQTWNTYALCTDASVCSGTGGNGRMLPNVQKYSLVSGTAYASGTSLSAAGVAVALDINKPTFATQTPQSSLYWGISIPSGQTFGSYSGINDLVTTESATGTW